MKFSKNYRVTKPTLSQVCLTGAACLATLTVMALGNGQQTFVLADSQPSELVASPSASQQQTPTRTVVIVDNQGQELHREVQQGVANPNDRNQLMWPDYFAPNINGYHPKDDNGQELRGQILNNDTTDQTVKLTFEKDSGAPAKGQPAKLRFDWHAVLPDGSEQLMQDNERAVKVGDKVPTPAQLVDAAFLSSVPKEFTIQHGGLTVIQLTVYPTLQGPLKKTVVRTINITFPDGHKKVIKQALSFHRMPHIGNFFSRGCFFSFQSWQPFTSKSFAEIPLPEFPGYTCGFESVHEIELADVFINNPAKFPHVFNVNIVYQTLNIKSVEKQAVKRRIILRVPGQDDQIIEQSVTATRTVLTERYTEKKTFEKWQFQKDFPAIKLPEFAGFTPPVSEVSALKPTVDMLEKGVSDVVINYEPQATSPDEKSGKGNQGPTTPKKGDSPKQETGSQADKAGSKNGVTDTKDGAKVDTGGHSDGVKKDNQTPSKEDGKQVTDDKGSDQAKPSDNEAKPDAPAKSDASGQTDTAVKNNGRKGQTDAGAKHGGSSQADTPTKGDAGSQTDTTTKNDSSKGQTAAEHKGGSGQADTPSNNDDSKHQPETSTKNDVGSPTTPAKGDENTQPGDSGVVETGPTSPVEQGHQEPALPAGPTDHGKQANDHKVGKKTGKKTGKHHQKSGKHSHRDSQEHRSTGKKGKDFGAVNSQQLPKVPGHETGGDFVTNQPGKPEKPSRLSDGRLSGLEAPAENGFDDEISPSASQYRPANVPTNDTASHRVGSPANADNNHDLPQTGSTSILEMILGLLSTAMVGFLGLRSFKKKDPRQQCLLDKDQGQS